MNPGQLNRRCQLQDKSSGVDSIGQPLNTWTNVATFWGNIKSASGYETAKSDKVTEVRRVSIRTRYILGRMATAGMRVVSNGINYNIEAVLPDEMGREYVDLVCEVIN
jgi:SPP1 family predicted phage head-tail adaptor